MIPAKEGIAHKAPRPFIMCAAALTVAVCVVFVCIILVLLVQGLTRWAHGLPVDLGGLAAVLGSLGTLLMAIGSFAMPIFSARFHTQIAQIQAGQIPGPFGASGGLPPVADAPRPGDSA